MKNHHLSAVALMCLLATSGAHALADSIDDYEAKKEGISVAQAQINNLKTENAALQAKLKAAEADNAALKKQAADLAAKAQADNAALKQQTVALTAKIDELSRKIIILSPDDPASAKVKRQVVMSTSEYAALPKVNKNDHFFSHVFNKLAVNEVGYIPSVSVVHVIDKSTALVEVFLSGYHLDSRGWQIHSTDFLLIEGLPTDGHADNTYSASELTSPEGSHPGWVINSWFKIVATKEYNGRTYFVAWPIVQGEATTADTPVAKKTAHVKATTH